MRLQNDDMLRTRYQIPSLLLLLSIVGIVIGLIGLGISFGLAAYDTWIWLIIFFVIFSGYVNALLVTAAVFRTVQAKWTPAFNRIGHSALFFTPILFLVLIVLMAGCTAYMPWIKHPVPRKEAWLNIPGLVTRDIVSLLVYWALCFFMVRWSLRADEKTRCGEEITDREHYRLNTIAAIIIAWYSVAATIISWDLIMSLSPRWASTMFAPYYFCTSVYAAMAIMVIAATALRKPLGIEQFLQPEQYNKLGNLMLAFSLLNMGFFYAQYLTIWYENLPEETFWLILRYFKGGSWPYIGWASFICAYAVPFVLLQSRGIKHSPGWLTGVSVLALLGVSLERYVMVVPSFKPVNPILFPVGVLIVFAFLGAFILTTALFFRRYAPISTAQVALQDMESEEMLV